LGTNPRQITMACFWAFLGGVDAAAIMGGFENTDERFGVTVFLYPTNSRYGRNVGVQSRQLY